VDWWTYGRLAATGFLDRHALAAAAIVVAVEEAGVPLPMLPGDLVMLLLGVRARQGQVALWQALLVLEAATVAGGTVLYVLCRRFGRGFVARYGRYLHLTPARLARAERWIERHGVLAVAGARLVPGLRIASAVGCGVLGVPARVFLPGLALGGFLYLLLYTLLGYYAGPAALGLVERVHLPAQLAGSLLGLAALLLWLGRARRALGRPAGEPAGGAAGAVPALRPRPRGRRPDRWRAGAAAGVVATLAATFAANALVHVAGHLDMDLLTPRELVDSAAAQLADAAARAGDLAPLLLAAPAYVAVGVLWGALYGDRVAAGLRRRGLPDWGAGLAFAAGPLAVALLVLLPVLGHGFPGSGASTAVAAGEAVRHAVYGVVLGLSYPVLLARPRAAPRPDVRPRRRPRAPGLATPA
jgi:membrane protein DedA with SNARE-associated domain